MPADSRLRVTLSALVENRSSTALRVLGAMVTPGGRQRLTMEIELDEVRNIAHAIGLPRERADELVAEINAHAATLPRAVPWSDICAEARRRLSVEAIGEPDLTPLHNFGLSAEEACEGFGRLGAYLAAPDQVAYDVRPDDCWRCDARPAAGAVGLCGPCHGDLVNDRSRSGE